MKDKLKKRQLNNYKWLATGLFLLMVLVYISSSIIEKQHPIIWIGYLRAFSEAAMVGALADWFAVTALFHHPLGLKIPHTNLIEKSKEKIGNNLGSFVVENFLSPQSVRPYIETIKISNFIVDWLAKENNQKMLVSEIGSQLYQIIQNVEDEVVLQFLEKRIPFLAKDLKINSIASNILHYFLSKNEHQKLITHLAKQISVYILANQDLVNSRVKKESFTLIPKFVDDAIASKITNGLAQYFQEIEKDTQHELREELTLKLVVFSEELKNEYWENKLEGIKNELLEPNKMRFYLQDFLVSVKKNLLYELKNKDSVINNFIRNSILNFGMDLKSDALLQNKIDQWVRYSAYKFILKNTHKFGDLISHTVGNWKGKDLSQKLELEVGKDLQFIRINGTLVGGLVGLLIYIISNLI